MGPVWYSSVGKEKCQKREAKVVVNIAYPFAVLYERINIDEECFEAGTMPSKVEGQVQNCQSDGGDTVKPPRWRPW